MATAAFKIDKNVPIAPDGRGSRCYPFGQMEIGDSFEADEKTAAARSAYLYGKRNGKRFTCRQTTSGKVRIWRIA